MSEVPVSPPPQTFGSKLKLIGPGIILAAAAIGSGEWNDSLPNSLECGAGQDRSWVGLERKFGDEYCFLVRVESQKKSFLKKSWP